MGNITKEIQKADRRKTTSLLKKHFRKTFNIETKVSSDVYSGGSSLNVNYILGPDGEIIKDIVKKLQYGNFNGMNDCYEYNNTSGLEIEGFQLEEFKYVFSRQVIPKELEYRLAKMFSDIYEYSEIPKIQSEDDFNSDFSKPFMGCWNWRSLLYCNFETRNFVTQDESKITIKMVNLDENCKLVFTYEVDGKEYTTDKYDLK